MLPESKLRICPFSVVWMWTLSLTCRRCLVSGASDVKGDYTAHLQAAAATASNIAEAAVAAALSSTAAAPALTLLTMDPAPLIGAGNCTLVVYNPLSWARSSLITLELPQRTIAVEITGPAGEDVAAQVRRGMRRKRFVHPSRPRDACADRSPLMERLLLRCSSRQPFRP